MGRLIRFPSNNELRMTNLVLNPINPRIEHTFENSHRRILLDRGDGWWEGTATFGPVRDAEDVRTVESFFMDLNSGDCYTTLLLIRPKALSRDNVGEGDITNVTDNVVRFSKFGRWLDVDKGAFICNRNTGQTVRVIDVIDENTNRSYRVQPNIVSWSRRDAVKSFKFMNIRLNTAVNLPVTPHWAGGWTMAFTEWRAKNVRT